MLCSNCGKDIPFAGKVCAWCHHDKSEDQRRYAATWKSISIGAGIGFGLGAIVGVFQFGFAGVLIFGGLAGVTGGVLGGIAALQVEGQT